jgi:hypothetical protein
MAAMPLARTARQVAAHGNIRISKSGTNLSGHSNPAIPNAILSWTTKHSPRLFMATIPMREFLFIGTRRRHWGKVTTVTLAGGAPPWHALRRSVNECYWDFSPTIVTLFIRSSCRKRAHHGDAPDPAKGRAAFGYRLTFQTNVQPSAPVSLTPAKRLKVDSGASIKERPGASPFGLDCWRMVPKNSQCKLQIT